MNSKEPRKRVSRKTASVGERDEKGPRTVGWYYVRKDAKRRKGKRRSENPQPGRRKDARLKC